MVKQKQKRNQCFVHSIIWTCVRSSSATSIYLVCYVIWKRHEFLHTNMEGGRMAVNWQFLTHSLTHASAMNFKLERILHNTYMEYAYTRYNMRCILMQLQMNRVASAWVELSRIQLKLNPIQQQQQQQQKQLKINNNHNDNCKPTCEKWENNSLCDCRKSWKKSPLCKWMRIKASPCKWNGKLFGVQANEKAQAHTPHCM